jgi:non-ribosomal peptide synthetase component E (peptide arylation enzyme)
MRVANRIAFVAVKNGLYRCGRDIRRDWTEDFSKARLFGRAIDAINSGGEAIAVDVSVDENLVASIRDRV